MIYRKDLSRLGRDLSKTLIVDNMEENFINQPENGVHILSWYDDMDDRVLEELLLILKEIAEKKTEDVRTALKMYKDVIQKHVTEGEKIPKLQLRSSPLTN